MSFHDPFDTASTLETTGCSCGAHASQAEHDKAAALSSDARLARVVESAMVRALIPQDQARRAFLCAVGASSCSYATLAERAPWQIDQRRTPVVRG